MTPPARRRKIFVAFEAGYDKPAYFSSFLATKEEENSEVESLIVSKGYKKVIVGTFWREYTRGVSVLTTTGDAEKENA